MENQIGRRADVQLLRGVAVLGVMLVHFGALVPGGFLGVDVFFAISGFVITLSFIKLSKQSKNLRELLNTFWRRRFWRLFPSLTVVLFVTLLFALLLLPSEDFNDQREMSVWSFFFAGNIGAEVLSKQDYFDPAAQFNWLLHLWSLGVEEQFYLAFPFLMIGLLGFVSRTRNISRALFFVMAASSASFLLSTVDELERIPVLDLGLTEMTGFSALLGYYSPLTRAWQFGIGVLLALLALWRPQNHKGNLLGLLGGLLLAGSFVAMPESNLLPGPLTLVPMLGVFLILRHPLSTRLLEASWLKPLHWLGDRSYSAYLWHWPVWSIVTALITNKTISVVLSFAFTLLLAALTFRWVEQPFISRSRTGSLKAKPSVPGSKFLSIVLAFALTSPLILGFAIWSAERFLRDQGLIAQREEVPRVDPAIDCIQTDCSGLVVDVLLIGDSHAGALSNALFEELASRGVSMRSAIVARHFGCLHLPSMGVASVHEECRDLSAQVREIITEISPRWVVIYGYTAGRFTTINSGGAQEISLVFAEPNAPVTSSTGVSAYESSLSEVVDFISKQGSKALIVSGAPDYTLRPEEVGRNGKAASLAEVFLAPLSGRDFGETVSRSGFLERHGPFIAVEEKIAQSREGVDLVSGWDALCGPESCAQTNSAGELLYADQDHLSNLGAEILARAAAETLSE